MPDSEKLPTPEAEKVQKYTKEVIIEATKRANEARERGETPNYPKLKEEVRKERMAKSPEAGDDIDEIAQKYMEELEQGKSKITAEKKEKISKGSKLYRKYPYEQIFDARKKLLLEGNSEPTDEQIETIIESTQKKAA